MRVRVRVRVRERVRVRVRARMLGLGRGLGLVGVLSFEQESRPTSFEFGAQPSPVEEGPVYRRLGGPMAQTLPDAHAAAPGGLLPVYRGVAAVAEPGAPPESVVPRLAKQKAFCSSKHGDDAAAAIPARGQGSSSSLLSELSNSKRLSGGGQP